MERDLIEEIRSLESHISDKDILIKKYDKEREILLKSVKKAYEDARIAYERLADLDISRHAEVSDLKQEIDRLRAENEGLRSVTPAKKEGGGGESLLKDDTLDKLKREVEVKKLQLQESEENLHKATIDLRLLELKYKELKDNYESLDSEKNAEISSMKACILETEKAFIERLSEMSDEMERLGTEKSLIKESGDSRDAEITQLKAEVEGLTKENVSLKDSLSHMSSLLDKKDKDNNEQIRLKYVGEINSLKNDISVRDEEIQGLKGQGISLASELDELKAKLMDAESALQARTADMEHIKSQHTDVLSEVKKLMTEKEDISAELKNSASETETLKNELQRLRSEKTEETTSLRAQLEDASIKVADMLERLQGSIADNISAAERLGKVSASVMKTMTLYPAVIEQKRKTGGKTLTFKNITIFLAVTAIAVVLAVMAGMYALREGVDRKGVTDSSEKGTMTPAKKVSVPPLKKPYKMPWAGTREVIHKDFRLSVTFLSPNLMDDYRITPLLTEEEKTQNYFYVLEINAEKGCIPPDVINSPFKAISFIDENDVVFKTVDILELDSVKKAIYRVKACKGETGAVFFRCFMAISSVNNPQGIIVGGLIKDLPIVIK